MGDRMNVNTFWDDILKQNRDALENYFHPDAVIRWHCSNEQFSVPEFIQANCDYPGEWDGKIERVDQHGNQLVTVVNVFPKDQSDSFHVVSFIELKGDTKNAQKYLESTPIIRGINGTELVDLVLKYYDDLSEKYRKMIPLKMVYIPVPKDE